MRAHHIDVAKALCIILVVIGHSGLAHRYVEVNEALQTFRMPLFFMLAGVFFKAEASPLDVLKHKSATLLKPYLSFALLYAPYYLYKTGPQELSAYMLGTLSFTGKWMPGWMFPLWFLTSLWALHTLGSVFCRWIRFPQMGTGRQFLLILSLLIGGQISIDWLWMRPLTVAGHTVQLEGLPFNIELWPVMAAFFLTGYVLRQEIKSTPPHPAQTLLAAAIFCACHVLHQPRMNLFEHQYSNIVTTTIAALSGAITIMGLAALLARHAWLQRRLTAIGQVNLYILLFHAPILSVMSKQLHQWVDNDLLALWLACLSAITASWAMAKVIRATPALHLLFEHSDQTPVRPVPAASSGGGDVVVR
ncbi:MAG TPA: acyltransferase family protein [Aquabacterium sp.]|uniref:acyltransferase family protein n=1 Tax=Aquabacterium sp. TaxID=1872578 RepID=UPI002E337AD4|nr:acyltransferase family protein [Aquabacterium sp.]HEX5355524.1 acyltransferase family protein [Aquabacterium sp.]